MRVANTELIDALAADGALSLDEFEKLLTTYTAADRDHAASKAYRIARQQFGTSLTAWGVVSVSNVCTKECLYCGLRRSNEQVERFRLSPEDVVTAWAEGHRLGFRTVYLEGGDDPELTDESMEHVIWLVKKQFGDSTVTLEFGERTRGTYERYFEAGGDAYVLRHESADADHFASLHPRRMTLANRIRCLEDLKAVGFSTGCGMMIGSPFQTPAHLARDLAFIADFDPASVSIGPFVPSASTEFADQPAGSIDKTLFVLSLVRIMMPTVDLPVLTSVATVHPRGREMAVMAGANVVMPNLTPTVDRAKFAPYDHKIVSGAEAAEGFEILSRRMAAIGYSIGPTAPEPRHR